MRYKLTIVDSGRDEYGSWDNGVDSYVGTAEEWDQLLYYMREANKEWINNYEDDVVDALESDYPGHVLNERELIVFLIEVELYKGDNFRSVVRAMSKIGLHKAKSARVCGEQIDGFFTPVK
jgi:hypothetical protein